MPSPEALHRIDPGHPLRTLLIVLFQVDLRETLNLRPMIPALLVCKYLHNAEIFVLDTT